MQSPCATEKVSLLSSLKTKTCAASLMLKRRALHNLTLGDDALIDMLTVPDSWFPDAAQGKDNVTLELWIDEPILAEERLLRHLKQIQECSTPYMCTSKCTRETTRLSITDWTGSVRNRRVVYQKC